MRIVTTSDWHGHLPGRVPECDLLILGGDYGVTPIELGMWLGKQKARMIVGVAGNSDSHIEKHRAMYENLPWFYLQDSGIEFEGAKIWGTPWTPKFFDWAFQKAEEDLVLPYAQIPLDTQILVSHGPPWGIKDTTHGGKHVGSMELLRRVFLLSELRLHVFGHIHESRGLYPRAYSTSKFSIEKAWHPLFVNTSAFSYGHDLDPFVFDFDFTVTCHGDEGSNLVSQDSEA